jgi:hypothetical protein
MFGKPLGSAMPMRSPRLTPDAARASATVWNLLTQAAVREPNVLFGCDDGRLLGGIAWINPSSVFEAMEAPSRVS